MSKPQKAQKEITDIIGLSNVLNNMLRSMTKDLKDRLQGWALSLQIDKNRKTISKEDEDMIFEQAMEEFEEAIESLPKTNQSIRLVRDMSDQIEQIEKKLTKRLSRWTGNAKSICAIKQREIEEVTSGKNKW